MNDLIPRLRERLRAYDEGYVALAVLESLPPVAWTEREKFCHSCGVGYGIRNEHARLLPLIEAMLKVCEAAEKTIERADDYGDSQLSQPVRVAMKDLEAMCK